MVNGVETIAMYEIISDAKKQIEKMTNNLVIRLKQITK